MGGVIVASIGSGKSSGLRQEAPRPAFPMILRPPMPVRATKRGADAHPSERRLRRPRLRRLVRRPDRRPRAARDAARACWCSTATRSASARPPPAPRRPSGCATSGLEASIRQTFGSLRRPHAARDRALAARLDVLDLRLPGAVRPAVGAARRRDGVRDRQGRRRSVSPSTTPAADAGADRPAPPPAPSRRRHRAHRPRRRRAPLVVDALGWKRNLGAALVQPPERAALARAGGPPGRDRRRPRAVDRQARDPRRLRLGVPGRATSCASGSARSTRTTTSRSRPCALADAVGLPPDGYQGNWIPHRLRPATEDGIFFVGDSAGHCLPLTAEGIRTAFYFGIALGRELRAVLEGRRDARPRRSRATARSPPRTAGSTSRCSTSST